MLTNRLLRIVTACAAVLLVGCDDEPEPIRHYRVPKPQVVDPRGDVPRPQRMVEPATPRPEVTPPPRPALAYDVPAGWREKPATGMRLAAFDVGEANAAEVTAVYIDMDLGVAGNINRWLGQVGRETVSPQAAGELVEPGPLSDRYESYKALLRGDEQSIAVAMVEQGGGWWFFKMMGGRDTVAEQAPALWRFVESVRFGEEAADE